MRLPRRAALAAPLVVLAGSAHAQAWPTGPVRFLVGAGPGGTTDIVARVLAPAIAEGLGQPVPVENRGGAGSTLAAQAIVTGRPDGGQMILLNNGHAVSAAMLRRPVFDAVADFAPVAVVAIGPLILLTSPTGPYPDLPAFLTAARARPEALNVATVGVGSTQHFTLAALESAAGARVTHVPYRTTPAALVALRNQEVDAVMETASAVLGEVRAGAARAVAVGGATRSELFPDVPTVAESGLPGFDLSTWYMIAFAGPTPPAIVERTRAATVAALARPDVRDRFLGLGLVTGTGGPDEARETLRAGVARMAQIRRDANIPQGE